MISYEVIKHKIELGRSILEKYEQTGKKTFSFTVLDIIHTEKQKLVGLALEYTK